MIDTNTASDSTENENVWRERCAGLLDLVKSLSWFDERSDFYSALASGLRALTGADTVNIRLLTPDQDSFVLYAFNGDMDSLVNREYGNLSANSGRMPQLIATGEPVVFDFAHPTSEDVAWKRGVEDGYACSVTVALTGSRGIVGTLDFLYHAPCECVEPEVDWLRSLGEYVGAIIDNALLSDNMMSLRVADERQRLAREVHDNIAQSVNVIALEVEHARDSFEQHDSDMLSRNLDLLRRASDELEKTVRGELVNLQAHSAADGDVSMAHLEKMAETFCERWGIRCVFERDESLRASYLSERVMTQLTRVVNEALVNVVRHANASRVTIAYTLVDGGLTLSIEDDGCGFDVDAVPASHLGLRIMGERLRTIDASLAIVSSPGCGTRIDIRIPHLV